MTIQERLKRSNMMMLVVPVVVAGVLLIAALGTLLLMLELVYLPRLGLSLRDLHDMGEGVEPAFTGLKGFILLYAAGFIVMLLSSLFEQNIYFMSSLILGLMVGSLYAIANGPASLDVSLPPLSLATVRLPAVAIGVVILLALEGLKKSMEKAA